MLHYLLVLVIIAVIVIIQLLSFADTRKKINAFLWIFPDKKSAYTLEYNRKVEEINLAGYQKLIELCEKYGLNSSNYSYIKEDENGNYKSYLKSDLRKALVAKVPKTSGIFINHKNYILETIANSINDYLQNNKTVSDFHLMKDIVDRRCDAKEEEISTQIPVPLYMGLVGTMAGILIGVGLLAFSGGLDALLENVNNGAQGIKELLGSVALAMISSILGIILTTLASNKFKNAKLIVERNKHEFLSWIQKELLPTLSDNVVGAIREMAGNLTAFNKEFSNNTSNLGKALTKVNDSFKIQTELLEAVNEIADKNLAHQNIELYNALKNSSAEIGTLAEYLQNCNQYLTNVKELNTKLDNYENRTQFIENASKFYSKHEHWLAENYDDANRKLQDVVKKYNEVIEATFNSIKTDIEGKRQDLGNFIDNQNAALKKSAGDLDKIVKALSELGEVQKAVKAFESAIKGQNTKIDRLAEHIEKLANAKTGGAAVQLNQNPPYWQIALISLIALSCTILAVNSFIKPGNQADKNTEAVQFQVPIASPPIKDTSALKDTSMTPVKNDSLKGP
jgi:ABC-type transporter Mla subunit MlaD